MKDEALEYMKSHWNEFMGVDKAIGPDKTVIKIVPDTKVYILAEEYGHAEWFAHHIHLPHRQFKYVKNHFDLYGARGIVVYYETHWRNNESHEIDDMVNILKEHGMVKVYRSGELEELLGISHE